MRRWHTTLVIDRGRSVGASDHRKPRMGMSSLITRRTFFRRHPVEIQIHPPAYKCLPTTFGSANQAVRILTRTASLAASDTLDAYLRMSPELICKLSPILAEGQSSSMTSGYNGSAAESSQSLAFSLTVPIVPAIHLDMQMKFP